MTELVRQDAYAAATLDERQRYISALASAGDLLPKAYMGRPTPNPAGGMFPARIEVGKLLLVAELGSSLGLHPASALQSIFIIDGKPSLSANLVAALVRKAGHKLRVRVEGEGETLTAIAELIRSDDPDFTFRVSWSHADAVRAALTGKDNWKKYERAMLKARAITEVVREGAPDVTLFAAYTPEELGATVTTEDGEPIELQQVQQQAPHSGAPKPEAPIAAPAEPAQPSFDYAAAIAGLATSAEARELYLQARTAGDLDLPIKQGRKKPRPLSEVLTEIGKALTKAEAIATAAEEEAIEGEIVDEGGPAALADDAEYLANGDQ